MKISWLLFKKSGKQSLGRLMLTAGAVALGMLMLLIFMSGLNALNRRSAEDRNLTTRILYSSITSPVEGVDPLAVGFRSSESALSWRDQNIWLISLRAMGASPPQIEDLPLPYENEFYVSSKLDEIIRENPDEDLGTRFGTKQIGIIPDQYVSSPDELLVIRGMSADEVDTESIMTIYGFAEKSDEDLAPIVDPGITAVMLVAGATMLLFPIVLFISVATQLGSAQREKRYAAMRLVGATKSQVTQVLAFESISAALVGTIVGSLIYLATLPLMAEFRFDGMRFWIRDLTVPANWYFMAVALTLLFCLFANWWGMRHVRTSPLGVARTQKIAKKPRLWRLLPLLAGTGFFAWVSFPAGQAWLLELAVNDPSAILLIMAAILSTMFGLVLAGPWLTFRISSIFAKNTKKATILLATRRISHQFKQVFRSVSGVVLALFAGSFYLMAVSGLSNLYTQILSENGYSQLDPNAVYVYFSDDLVTDSLTAELQKQDYIESVTTTNMTTREHAGSTITCAELATYTKRRCPAGSSASSLTLIDFDAPIISDEDIHIIPDSESTKNAENIIAIYLIKLNSSDDLDKLRTLLAKNVGFKTEVISGAHEQTARFSPIISELSGLVYVAMAITLFIAIASLIISTIGGLLERRRSLTTLKLSGMTIAQMKKMVMIESLIPLVIVSLLAAGIGGWLGATFITIFSTTLTPTLSPLYFIIILGGLAVATLGIYCILPKLNKITSLEENRTE